MNQNKEILLVLVLAIFLAWLGWQAKIYVMKKVFQEERCECGKSE